MTTQKPPHGSPCVNCGFCCRTALCSLARDLVAPEQWREPDVLGPCPFLETGADGLSACGLAAHPATYFPLQAKAAGNSRLALAAKEMIGTDLGCDSLGDDEAENEAFNEVLAQERIRRRAAISMARRMWGVPA